MPDPRIAVPREKIALFCRQNGIRRLALFGSVLRDDFVPESDLDVLVEFEQGHRVGFGFVRLQDELSRILGRPVDLNTREDLSRYFRDDVGSAGLREGRCPCCLTAYACCTSPSTADREASRRIDRPDIREVEAPPAQRMRGLCIEDTSDG